MRNPVAALALAAVQCLLPGPAFAQSYPSKPVRLIVGFPAGIWTLTLAGVSSLYPAPRTPSSRERSGDTLKPPPAMRPAAPRSPWSWSFERGASKAKPPNA